MITYSLLLYLMDSQERWEALKKRYHSQLNMDAKTQAQARAHMADIVKDHTDEMVERWNREMDTLLVYVRHRYSNSQIASHRY